MNLDDDVQNLLVLIKQAGRPALDSLPPAEARLAYAAGRNFLQPDPEDVAETRDFTIPGLGGAIPVRLYRGTGTDPAALLPCLVFFHGGGWVIGDLDSHDQICRRIANAAACAVLAVDYRLAPEHKFPGAIEDCISAMRFAIHNASELRVDPAKVAVGGDSAGGNLAAACALVARDTGIKLTHQMLIYPVTDMGMSHGSYQRIVEGLPLVAGTMKWFIDHYLRDDADGLDWRASPLRASSLKGVAPATMVIAAHDPLADEGRAYATRLELDGVLVTCAYFSGQIHGFVSMGKMLRASDVAIDLAASTLRASWT